MDILIQAIGFAAVIAFIVSYQVRSNRKLFLFQMIGCGLFSLQFLLLGAYSGCLSLLVNIARSLMLMQYNKRAWVRSRIWPVVFCAAFLLIVISTWAGPVSLLAFTASAVSTVLYWNNNARLIRAANLFCASPCWLIYDCIVGSWGGALNEAITLGSIAVSVFRFGWKALGDPNADFQKD